ncbi:ANM_HP_G0089360.mRNA.1.CDS.1 [Saccharomyces cerevisiae]|nr:ANM_HP_G0134750.mRNA.1.CDS.1 [Saccharomyces cerevisiae]CAI5055810.1 ANM_HP_G0200740.mRNA.1.CDS.1 [Saccharomyces cerevisiae]CAI5209516.1 ANM_HP_G0267200.mRNA.1.CDS.1 [Saccharomyces cerevisiae]CAI5214388.1 ANM_HP_G0015700.mRNA.1.CDS.1 [Saccharomyces cerevisiae]CAI5227079.1 ANM_HP_G0089360.mRNA.1.CDS.1 [Saccharomyces cerevisiae]
MDTSNSWFDASKVQSQNFDLQTNSYYSNARGSDPSSYAIEGEYKTLATDDLGNILNLNYGETNEVIMNEINDLNLPLGPLSDEKSVKVSTFSELIGNDWQSMNFDLENNSREVTLNATSLLNENRLNQDSGMTVYQKTMSDKPHDEKKISMADNLLSTINKSEINKGFDRNLGELLLQQQQELREQLRAQQEANKKLELELKQTQYKQQQLQATLENSDGPQFLSPKRKISPASENVEDVYANSLSPMISPPMSNTSFTGSPSRRNNRQKYCLQRKNSSGTVGPLCFQELNEGFNDSLISPKKIRSNPNENLSSKTKFITPFTPKSRVSSATSNSANITPNNLMLDFKINVEGQESEYSEKPLGLGIELLGKPGPSPTKSVSLKSASVDIMPTIPGSVNNTPSVNKVSLSSSYIDQYTPRGKQLHFSSISENALGINAATPHLKPPSQQARHREGVFNDLDPNVLTKNTDNEGDDNEENEPESRFVISETPSPILKSQSKYEGRSPQFGTHIKEINTYTTNSPSKITRKLTTLPRGSIDKYVKEMPDKTFECLFPGCTKTFKRRYNIRSHIQTHLEDRPYSCDHPGCDKAFVRNHDLIRHKKSHQEKAYACPCGKKFNREDALVVHRSRMICSGGKKYENVVIKRSPRKRGRPRKDGTSSVSSSPIKENINKDHNGQLMFKLEDQLRRERSYDGNGTGIMVSPMKTNQR